MAIQNKSECKTGQPTESAAELAAEQTRGQLEQQLGERASLILQNRRHSTPAKTPGQMVAGSENTSKTMSNQQSAPEIPAAQAPGLKQKLRAIPGLGYALAWCQALLRLPRTRFQTEVALTNLQQQIERLNMELHLQQQALKMTKAEAEKSSIRLAQYDALDIGKRLMDFDRMHIGRQLRAVNLMMRQQLQNTPDKTHPESSGSAEKELVTVSAPSVSPVSVAKGKPDSDFDQDQFYLEFEALFRGSREDIKQRLKVYLPYLSHISSQPKEERKIVIDVGCGRGEWLDLLDEQGIPAMGVDMNLSMVNACLEQGFLVRHDDAIAYLRQQAEGSIGAVTGFQIIEHLPFEQLIALFDAARHALCPGGVIIFETPNPENLKVGACNFYFDPTHLHPIVPQVAEFMARQRGFSHAEILRLHPYPDDHLLKGGTEVETLINKELFGAQDYAVIGRK